MATSVPVMPIARDIGSFKAWRVIYPVPVIATTAPCRCQARTMRILSSGASGINRYATDPLIEFLI